MRVRLSAFAGILLASQAAFADDKPLDASPQGRSAEPIDANPKGSFEFGSYGRVGIASDLQGRVAESNINLVSHGPRFDEDAYVELELRREDTFKEHIQSRVVATLALVAPFFHF